MFNKKLKSILLSIAVLFPITGITAPMSTNNMITGEGFVYRVLDGDTYDVNVKNPSVYYALKSNAKTTQQKSYFKDRYGTIRIRLGAVDTAESVHYDPNRNTAQGKSTSNYVKEKLSKQNISFTCWDMGKYGRLICSVRLGDTDLGLHLIKHGFSSYYDDFGNHPYLHKEYLRAENQR